MKELLQHDRLDHETKAMDQAARIVAWSVNKNLGPKICLQNIVCLLEVNSRQTRITPHLRLKCRSAFVEVVGAIGFEPTTYGTQNRRATRLRHAPTVCLLAPLFTDEKTAYALLLNFAGPQSALLWHLRVADHRTDLQIQHF